MSLVRLSFELGMAVSDYNCGITNDHSTIIRTTFMYLNKVKESPLTEEELVECYSIIGQMWASVIERPEEVNANPLESTKPLEPAKVEAKPTKVEAKVEAKPTKVEAKVEAKPTKVEAKVEAKPTKVEAKVEAKPTKVEANSAELDNVKASLSTIVSSLTKKPEPVKPT